MGTRVPEITFATNCPYCFPSEETPEFVYVYFAGIEKCPLATKEPPNGQTFRLAQSAENPCFYEHWGSEWHVFWRAYDNIDMQSMLYLEEVDGLAIFASRAMNCPPECHVYHSGIQVCAWPVAGRFGVGVVHWMGIVLSIIVGLNLPSSAAIMHELFVTEEDKIVHKFCILEYGINVKCLMA